jgi:hypothetical protein
MTIPKIRQTLKLANKPVSQRQLYRYLAEFEIRPVSARRQTPQHYPDDTADRILSELGLKVVSMPQLRSARRQAQKARAAK